MVQQSRIGRIGDEELGPQFQRPSLSGVPIDRVLVRASKLRARVSIPPFAFGSSNGAELRLWKVPVLVYEKPGDQVIHDARSIGAGVIETVGNVCVVRLVDRFCERLPPTLKAPQSKRLSKFRLELSCAVVW